MATPDAELPSPDPTKLAWPRPSELFWILGARALASFSAYASGFRALSDDDYARLTIAQRFAAAPSFNPSGTSWLPVPFWIYGSAFRCFSTELGVARAVAGVLGLCAAVLVYLAARLLGAGRRGALLGAVLSAVFPYSAFLGIATVPEVPTAALLLFGAATLAGNAVRLRVLGGIALGLACGSRYEAWPVAGVFAGLCLCSALSRREPRLLLAAACALLLPAVWLALGHFTHGSAFFFISRVTAYRRALGGDSESFGQRLLVYPALLLRAEPELWSLGLALALLSPAGRAIRRLQGLTRPLIALCALLAFMMLGSVRDGVPTHHAARVLLPLWFLLCVVCGQLFAVSFAAGSAATRTRLIAAGLLASTLGVLLRPALSAREGFAERALELEVGAEARRRAAPSAELAVLTRDYGYFAVLAAFGAPTRARVIDDHDPRKAPPAALGAAEPPTVALATALRAQAARLLVVPRDEANLVSERYALCFQNAGFALFERAPRD